MPGWIHRHAAVYDRQNHVILVSDGDLHVLDEGGEPDLQANDETFELDLTSLHWRHRQVEDNQ